MNKDNRYPFSRLSRVCRNLGLKIKYGGIENFTAYQNKTIYLAVYGADFIKDNITTPPQAFYELMHELTHYLLAKPGQRRLPNYSFKGEGDDFRTHKRAIYEDIEEDKTDFVESLILKKLKIRYKYKSVELLEKEFSKRERQWPALGWWLDHKEQYVDLINLLF